MADPKRLPLPLLKVEVEPRAFSAGVVVGVVFVVAVVLVMRLIDTTAGLVLGGLGLLANLVLTYLVNRK